MKAFIAITPWVWIVAKCALFGDMYDMIPLIICGLFVWLNRTAQKDQSASSKKIGKVDGCCQTTNRVSAATQTDNAQNLEISTHDLDCQKIASPQIESRSYEHKCTQTLNIGALKVFVPVIQKWPKNNISPDKEFLRHHKNKHLHQRKVRKFLPSLEMITEVDENDVKQMDLLFQNESEDAVKKNDSPTSQDGASTENGDHSTLEISNVDKTELKLMDLLSPNQIEDPVQKNESCASLSPNLLEDPVQKNESSASLSPNQLEDPVQKYESPSSIAGGSTENGDHSIEKDKPETAKKVKKHFHLRKRFKNLKKLFKH